MFPLRIYRIVAVKVVVLRFISYKLGRLQSNVVCIHDSSHEMMFSVTTHEVFRRHIKTFLISPYPRQNYIRRISSIPKALRLGNTLTSPAMHVKQKDIECKTKPKIKKTSVEEIFWVSTWLARDR